MSSTRRAEGISTHFFENLFNNFLPSAVEGDPRSQFEVAEIWYFVVGLPDIAFGWYQRAARARHPKAAHRLARMYLAGTGIDEDPSKAMLWGLIAVALGETDAVSVAKTARSVLTQDEIRSVLARFREWKGTAEGV